MNGKGGGLGLGIQGSSVNKAIFRLLGCRLTNRVAVFMELPKMTKITKHFDQEK